MGDFIFFFTQMICLWMLNLLEYSLWNQRPPNSDAGRILSLEQREYGMFNFRKKSRNKPQTLKQVSTAPAAEPAQKPAPTREAPAAVLPGTAVAAAANRSTAREAKVSFAELLIAVRDRSADKASDAVMAMGVCGDPAAVDVLIEVARNDDHYFHTVVRVAAIKSLGAITDPRALEALITATRDTMAEVSEEAIKALGTRKDARAIVPLINILHNADHFFLPSVRSAAVVALKALGGPQAAAELKAIAADPKEDPTIRAAAQ